MRIRGPIENLDWESLAFCLFDLLKTRHGDGLYLEQVPNWNHEIETISLPFPGFVENPSSSE
jgi:hypothetical protein